MDSPHALMNDLVLKEIFGHLRPRDLKGCRLVCTKWNILTIPHVRTHFEVKLKNGDEIEEFLDCMDSNTIGIPFQKFRLGRFTSMFEALRFVQLLRPNIKMLHFFSNGFVPHDYYYIEDMAVLLEYTPELESLTIPDNIRMRLPIPGADTYPLFPGTKLKLKEFVFGEYKTYWGQRDANKRIQFPIYFRNLFHAAENISTITCHDTPADLEILGMIEHLGKEASIHTLSLFRINSEHLDLLTRMANKQKNGLKLKNLSIMHGHPDFLWFQIVDLFRHTLTSLFIRRIDEFYKEFPIMPRLESLDLEISKTSRNAKSNFFKTTFPALKVFKFYTKSLDEITMDDFWCKVFEENSSVNSLSVSDFKITTHTLRQTFTHNILQSLNELTIQISTHGARTLQQIWIQDSRLEKLRIYGRVGSNTCMDSLLTGFTPKEVKTMPTQEIINSLQYMTSANEREREIFVLIQRYGKCTRSIRSLTGLRELELSLTSALGRKMRYLNDFTAFFSFYPMKNLRHLDVRQSEISRPCWDILVAEMNLESWSIDSRNSEVPERVPFRYRRLPPLPW